MATFFVHQKITAFANQYRIYDGRSGTPGDLIAFAHQKRLAFRERFIFYTDETKTTEAFHIQARKVLDFGSSYDVSDADGQPIGIFRKAFGASLLRSTWEIVEPGDEQTVLVMAQERSVPIAVLRRLWSWVPYLGETPFFIRYHFDLLDPASQRPVGTYDKLTRIRDHYRLDVDDAVLGCIDWRTFVCLGVVMDALQGR